MTCRHAAGDPNCSSSAEYRRRVMAAQPPATPDKNNYSIEDVHRIKENLVLKVKYPNCKNCAYEGCKIMVFLGVTEAQVLKWKTIDPHFRAPNAVVEVTMAPSPAARFPGSKEGWRDAIEYATRKAS